MHGLVLKLLQGGVTPIDSIVTAATALVSGVTTHSSVYFRKCARSQRSTVEIQRSQRSKPENQRGQRSKRRKELVKVLTLRSQL